MTTSQNHELRVETRLDLEATIFIEVIASDGRSEGTVLMCNSLDLSAGGLQVVVDEEIAAGSILRLCIDLKDAAPMFLVGEVKWQRPDPETQARRLGFALFDADGSDIRRWKEIVARMLG